MGLSVYWTQFAEEKLSDIYRYYRNRAGVNVVRKLVNGIVDATEDLEKNHRYRANPFVWYSLIVL